MKKYKKGYTTGVFDMFHVGHLNILERSKELCEHLIVGVTVDELVSYKNTTAIIPYEDRRRIIQALKVVDETVAQETMDKYVAYMKYGFDVIFVGSDWKGTKKWIDIENLMAKYGVDIVYFDYTSNISSSALREHLSKLS